MIFHIVVFLPEADEAPLVISAFLAIMAYLILETSAPPTY